MSTILYIKKHVLPYVVLLIFFGVFIFSFIQVVDASEGFKEHSNIFNNLQDSEIDADKDTFPYNTTANINSVGLDIVFGVKRGIIYYNGEVPWNQTHDNNGDVQDQYSGIPSKRGTSLIEGENGVYGWDMPPIKYWGLELKSDGIYDISGNKLLSEPKDGIVAKNDLEGVNGNKIVSLRLYALTNASYDFWEILGNFFYWLMRSLNDLARLIIKIILLIKNIDLVFIVSAFGLKEIATTFTESFIYSAEQGLSPVTLIAIILFVFALVGIGIRYARGAQKTKGLKDVLVTAIVGILIIGMCLSGKIGDLGSSLANGVSKLFYIAALAGEGDKSVFKTDISGGEYSENTLIYTQELSLINKIVIDTQICTQFKVDSIKELDVDKIGTDGSLWQFATAKGEGTWNQDNILDTLVGSTLGNNIGYYFWFANSWADHLEEHNAVLVENNSNGPERRLTTLITYLQTNYNEAIASGKSNKATNIQKLISGLCNPSAAYGALIFLLLTVVFALMALCLWSYAWKVVLNKITFVFAFLGMTVAGPMLLSSKEELIKKAKGILGLILVSIINMTVYATVFDIIVYITTKLLTTDIVRIIVTGVILYFLWRFNPKIEQALQRMLDNMERSIAPDARVLRSSIKSGAGRTLERLDNWHQKHNKKVIGTDENGDPIYDDGASGHDFFGAGIKLLKNSTKEGANKESGFKILHDQNKERKEAEQNNAVNIKNAADRNLEKINIDIKNQGLEMASRIKKCAKDREDQIIQKDQEGVILNIERESLDSTEINLCVAYEAAESAYTGLQERISNGTATEEEAAHLGELKAAFDSTQQELTKHIHDRVTREELENSGLDIIEEQNEKGTGIDLDKTIASTTQFEAQKINKDKLLEGIAQVEEAITDDDYMREDQSENGGKIGHRKRTTINKDSIDEYLALSDQKEQLEQGVYVQNIMAGSKAKEERKQYVKADAELTQIEKNVQRGYGIKVEQTKDEKAATKATVKEVKENVKELNKQRKAASKGKSFSEKRTIKKQYQEQINIQKGIKNAATGKDAEITHKQVDKQKGHVTIKIGGMQGTAHHATGKDQIDEMKNRTRAANRPTPIQIQPERPQEVPRPEPANEPDPMTEEDPWAREENRERTQSDPDLGKKR